MPSLPVPGPGSPAVVAFSFARHGLSSTTFVSSRSTSCGHGKMPPVPVRELCHTTLTNGRLGLLPLEIFTVKEGVPGLHDRSRDTSPLALLEDRPFSLQQVEQHLLAQQSSMFLLLQHSMLNIL